MDWWRLFAAGQSPTPDSSEGLHTEEYNKNKSNIGQYVIKNLHMQPPFVVITSIALPASIATPRGGRAPQPAFQGASLQQHPALALEAPDADIGTYPEHQPLVAAAGVLLFQADNIAQPDLRCHSSVLRKLGITRFESG